jgi:hypothetical protein
MPPKETIKDERICSEIDDDSGTLLKAVLSI